MGFSFTKDGISKNETASCADYRQAQIFTDGTKWSKKLFLQFSSPGFEVIETFRPPEGHTCMIC